MANPTRRAVLGALGGIGAGGAALSPLSGVLETAAPLSGRAWRTRNLLDYDPEPWEPLDTYLVGQQIAWGLTGCFRTLRMAVLRDRLSPRDYRRLYARPFDHGAPVLDDDTGGAREGVGRGTGSPRDVDAGFVDALAPHEPSPRPASARTTGPCPGGTRRPVRRSWPTIRI